MSGKEPEASADNRQDGELSESELEQAAGGKRTSPSESAQTAKNRACFRMLEEDFLFKRLERRGWRR
jgi:hypothetical protein